MTLSVVKFTLTFLSLLCWGTPPHNCSIVCIAISVIPVDQLKGYYYWVWDPTLKWYYIRSGVIEIQRQVVGLWICIQKEVYYWFTKCCEPSKVWFLHCKKPMRPYFFCIIPSMHRNRLDQYYVRIWNKSWFLLCMWRQL